MKEALDNASDALTAIIEVYEDLGRPLPSALKQLASDEPISAETLVPVKQCLRYNSRDCAPVGFELESI